LQLRDRKGKKVDLYSAYRQYLDVDHLQIHHICLSFL